VARSETKRNPARHLGNFCQRKAAFPAPSSPAPSTPSRPRTPARRSRSSRCASIGQDRHLSRRIGVDGARRGRFRRVVHARPPDAERRARSCAGSGRMAGTNSRTRRAPGWRRWRTPRRRSSASIAPLAAMIAERRRSTTPPRAGCELGLQFEPAPSTVMIAIGPDSITTSPSETPRASARRPKGSARRAARCPPSAINIVRAMPAGRSAPRPRCSRSPPESGWPRHVLDVGQRQVVRLSVVLHQRLGELARVADGEEQRDAGKAGARTAREAEGGSLDCDASLIFHTQREVDGLHRTTNAGPAITATSREIAFSCRALAFGVWTSKAFCSPRSTKSSGADGPRDVCAASIQRRCDSGSEASPDPASSRESVPAN